MKQFIAFLLVAGISCQLAAQNMQPLALSSPIPMADVKMKATDGKQYSIADVKGKNGVLVMFSCNTCPYVVRYQSRTREILKSAKENGFGIIIINSNEAQRDDEDSFAAMKAYGDNQGYANTPYVVDQKSAVANAFGATRTPELFLFNSRGILVYHGAIDDNHIAAEAKRPHAKLAMEESANGKDISVKESRSVGCMIKRL
jgi:hypothetical protein